MRCDGIEIAIHDAGLCCGGRAELSLMSWLPVNFFK